MTEPVFNAPRITDTQRRVLAFLHEYGDWFSGRRSGPVIGSVATALWRQGLVDRVRPSRDAAFDYRITDAGREALRG